MKFPICDVCLKSGILCRSCNEKIGKEFSESDVRIFRSLDKLSTGTLEDVRLLKVLEAYDLMVLVVDDVPKVVGKSGILLKSLSKEYERPVRVVAGSGNYREFLKNMLHPTGIMGINVIYLPGREILKVIVPKGSKIPVSPESLNEIMKKEFGKEITVVKG